MTGLRTKLHLWKELVTVGVSIFIMGIVADVLLYNRLEEIPRSALLEFSDLLATLLGLTFTAFAILVGITPMIRKDFLRTDVFDSIGKIFYVTLILQFFSLILTFISYFLFGHNVFYFFANLATISLTVWSLGCLLYSIQNLFRLFKVTKNKISKED